ncbi:hypothetical protein BD770DRAFT_7425 [Pilaira anomala]|nr:hypothetical protein BD770DRAFT_7425 [Pilaira anomala]
MHNNHRSLKSLEDVLIVSQNYMNIFDILDIKRQGYLDGNQAQLYLTSIDFGKEYRIIHDAIPDIKESDCLIMKQFVLIMYIAQYRHKDIIAEEVDFNSYLAEFSDCLRHCEEALQAIEHYKFFSLVTLAELKTKFSQAFSKLEYILKQIVNTDIQQKPEFNFSHEKQGIPSPPQEKVLPGSFDDDEHVKNIEREVRDDSDKMSVPQSNPGFLGQSHQEASTLTLRSQTPSPEPHSVSKRNSSEVHDDITSDTNSEKQQQQQQQQQKESEDAKYSYDSHLAITDVISNITTSVTGIASLVGLSNSPKGETRGLDVVPETNQDIVQPIEAKDVTPLPIKPDNVDDSIPIDAPIDSKLRDNDSNEHQNLTKEEINQGADALKEIAHSIPVTNTPDSPRSSHLSAVYDAKRLAEALDEKTALEIQAMNEKNNNENNNDKQNYGEKNNADSSDKNFMSDVADTVKSVIEEPISRVVKPLDTGMNTDLDSLNDHMDGAMNDRPAPMENKESFGEAIIIVPVEDDSEDKQHFSSLDHDGRIKDHPDDFYNKKDMVSFLY